MENNSNKYIGGNWYIYNYNVPNQFPDGAMPNPIYDTTSNPITQEKQQSKPGTKTNRLMNTYNSIKNIASSGKYLSSLIGNPSNVHRILFKNANFISFINFDHIKRLYCKDPKNLDCIKLDEGYLYTKDQQIKNETTPIKSDPYDAKSNEELKPVSLSKYISLGFERLDFAKLNDALLTDNPSNYNNPNPNSIFISFKDEYKPLFEFFHTFKYQFHRLLWSGGWSDWTYLIVESKVLLFKNDNEELKAIFEKKSSEFSIMKIKSLFKDPNKYKNDLKNPQATLEKLDESGQATSSKYSNEKSDDTDISTTNVANNSKKTGGVNFTRSVKKLGDKIGSAISEKTGMNISKYRVYRKLLKYYDIDIGKYNLNLLKVTGILTKNYTVFMEKDAKKAVMIAVLILSKIKNKKIGEDDINAIKEYYNKDTELVDKYNTIAGKNDNLENILLDSAVNLLMKNNLTTADIEALEGKRSGGSRSRRKTRKIGKLTGGSMLFFYNLNIIFKECYHNMVKMQFNNIEKMLPGHNAVVGKFFADLFFFTMNTANILCFTPLALVTSSAASEVGLHGVSAPHCMITNIAAVYLFFKLEMHKSIIPFV